MKLTRQLIGREIEVVGSPQQHYLGMKGIVIDESKSTIVLQQQGTIKILLKGQATFRLGKEVIAGYDLRQRPEERIK